MFILSRIEYFAEVSSMDLASIIKGRRSIRDFQDKELPEEHLLAILEAGIWAPSGSNIQPWEFVLVNDSILIKKIKLLSPGLYGMPKILIILCMNKKRSGRAGRQGPSLAIMDISMAAQNMMLMAYSLGIGSCPIASFNKSGLKELLDIPEEVDPVLMISLGYPSSWPHPPERRPLEEVVHVNAYGKHLRR
jgi:nitroreductase